MPQNSSQSGAHTQTRTREPQMYCVIMHNDDITTMEFVVYVLRNVFFLPLADATQLMLNVHLHGSASVGVYTYDTAISKVNKSMQMAREEGYPFRMTVEPCE